MPKQILTYAKNQSVDIFRLIAALLVVSIHALLIAKHSDTVTFFSVILTRPAVPFFFVVSGYFLSKKLLAANNIQTLFNYLKKIIIVYLAWSCIYFPYDMVELFYLRKNMAAATLVYLKNFFLSGGHFHLWFFPALMFSSIIFYLFSKYDKLKYFFVLIPLVYLAGLLGDSYYYLIKDTVLWSSFILAVDALGGTRNGLFFGLPYLFSGYLILKYENRLKGKNLLWFFVISFFFYALEWIYLFDRFYINKYNYNLLLAPTVFLLSAYLIVYDPWKNLKFRAVKYAKNLSLLVYCSHCLPLIFFQYYFYTQGIKNVNYALASFLMFFSSLLLSIFLVCARVFVKKHLIR